MITKAAPLFPLFPQTPSRFTLAGSQECYSLWLLEITTINTTTLYLGNNEESIIPKKTLFCSRIIGSRNCTTQRALIPDLDDSKLAEKNSARSRLAEVASC